MAIVFPETFNMATYFLDHNIAAGRADKVCLYYRDEMYTYRDIVRASNRVGNALRALGVEMEDRVLMVLPDCPEFVASWFGIAKIGAVITMVNTILPPSDYEYYLNYTRAKVAIVHESAIERVHAVADRSKYLKEILVVGEGPGSYPSYDRLIDQMSDELEVAETSRDDVAIWLFTSGSTGFPKAAVHLHHDLPYNTECYAKQVLRIQESDLTMAVPKLFFGYATGTNLLFPFAVGGATAIFPERSTPERLFDMIEKYRPTVLTSVPTMINAMVQAPDASRRDVSSLRVCISAGEALPVELYHRWKEMFGVEILDGIGSAETFHIYISNRLDDVKPGSLGKVVPGYQAKIVDPEGRQVPPGQIGTLWIKGDSAAIGYWQAHEKSKQVFHGDWVNTGDQFRQDEEGYFYYCGRADDMLKVGGIWVSPVEIENCLLQHEAVKECAVVGYRDEQGLVKPKAFVVLKEAVVASHALEQELKEFVKTTIAPYKYPRRIEFIDQLPKNERGKVDRKKLKGMA